METGKKPASRMTIILCGLAFLVLIPAVITILNSGKNSSSTQAVQQVQNTNAPDYTIAQQWSIPNGGAGKLIVIAPEHANEADLIALGEKLKADTAGDRNATIMVFTDAKAAALYSKLSKGLTPTEDDFYNTHFVATYDRNINTGYHQLSIFPAGVMSDHKDIAY